MNRAKTDDINIPETELIQYFKSALTKEDSVRIEAWIEESEAHKALAKDIYTATLAEDILHTVHNINAHEGLKKVNKRIERHRIKTLLHWSQRVAAILFIPLLVLTAALLIREANKETEYISFRTNPGIIADFSLPDGTKVWLNAHSSLKYPSQFRGKAREVELSGEAYFEVEPDKKHPFIVNLNDKAGIEVTGTAFNVDAFETNEEITAMLVSGEIRMNYTHGDGKTIKRLKPGEKIILNLKTGESKQVKASALVETGWKDGKIFLENTPLVHLLHTLSKRFDVDFVLENEKLKDNYFTGSFASQDLNLILKHLEVSSNIKHRTDVISPDTDDKKMVITLF